MKSEPSNSSGGPASKNGELLSGQQATGFEVFLTADQNLQFQQNISQSRLGVVVLVASSNKLEDLLPLMPRVAQSDCSKHRRTTDTCRRATLTSYRFFEEGGAGVSSAAFLGEFGRRR